MSCNTLHFLTGGAVPGHLLASLVPQETRADDTGGDQTVPTDLLALKVRDRQDGDGDHLGLGEREPSGRCGRHLFRSRRRSDHREHVV
ncbi:hypothetical protein DSLPV1_186 [Dishui lake phycodnavirus 1]|uniref:hypothetical protein n=1 Tax=Dishui lake phycodnavirus 1 TaxID=2079134 RepID=UPI000CD6B84A|nr:hypothetical protein C5Y57_gp212 [Dishui lake phycodnavirus 1]AUT19157.1 hypothetical protein DSLPV1_186 [Dishui lake phycodnavirus 1]